MIRSERLEFGYQPGAPLSFPEVAIEQGQTLLLHGPSGCGKSTWLALAAGLVRPWRGRMQVAGQDMQALSGARLDAWRGATIGFLPQRLHLSEALTVEGNLALAYVAAGLPLDRAAMAQVLRSLGLEDLVHRRPSQLSGGQAQRVALARAVLRRPAVLLVDEPTASLDDDACHRVLGLLDDAARAAGATMVVATHDRRVSEAWPGISCLTLPGRQPGVAP